MESGSEIMDVYRHVSALFFLRRLVLGAKV